MAEGYTIKHVDEFEEMEGSGGATWRLARKTLEPRPSASTSSTSRPAARSRHNHSKDDQEEVYVSSRRGILRWPVTRHAAPAGTFCRLARGDRTIRNRSDAPLRALVIASR